MEESVLKNIIELLSIPGLIAGFFGIGKVIVDYRLKHKYDYPVKRNEIKMPNLAEHNLFERMKYFMNVIIINFNYHDKGKEMLVKEVLFQKFRIWNDNLYTLAVTIQGEIERGHEFTNQELKKIVMDNFNKTLNEYTTYFENQRYSTSEKLSFQVFMGKFNEWHMCRVAYVEEQINSKIDSEFYYSPSLKMSAILDSYYSAFSDTIVDAEKALFKINGDLDGLFFGGYEIGAWKKQEAKR